MTILSISTSSTICAVAILEDFSIIKEITLDNGLTHSETLMPMINEILKESKLNLTDIDLITCDIGPGSFTGIRIGIATAKAFCDSLGIKAIGVSSLEALCYNINSNNIVCSLIDARKENIYCQISENIQGNYILRRNASFENIDLFLSELKNMKLKYDITFVGDGSINYKNKILEYLPNSNFADINNISAGNIGKCGYTLFNKKELKDLTPLYLRKTQAEQVLEDKLNGAK